MALTFRGWAGGILSVLILLPGLVDGFVPPLCLKKGLCIGRPRASRLSRPSSSRGLCNMLFLEDSTPGSGGEFGIRVKAHGRHICLDYTGFVVPATQGAELTLRLMRNAVREAGVREVHSKVVVLGEDRQSPPGFTAVCLVDESHVTAHCYSDRGWLAIDVFTCGAHPPEDIATWLHNKILAEVEGLKLMRGVKLDRFLHTEVPYVPPVIEAQEDERTGSWLMTADGEQQPDEELQDEVEEWSIDA